MSQTEPSYDIAPHPRAEDEFEKLPHETRRRLGGVIAEMATLRNPAEHTRAKALKNTEGLLRAKIERHRAILARDGRELKLLLVGHRDGVYDRLDVAERRRDE